MNICFLLGKVVDNVEFKFIYNSKNVSISIFKLMLSNKSIVECEAYDEIADYIYRNIKKGNLIFIEGTIKHESIEICKIKNLEIKNREI